MRFASCGARLRQHLHFIFVISALTLVMTYPTIAYVFQPDARWLPETRNLDVFIKLWDIWYGSQVLSGQADRFHTDLIYYPEGVSLAYHSLSFPFFIAAKALQVVMPAYSAYSLGFLLSICSSAAAAYFYLLWLFRDKWLSLFGAVIFAFAPQVVGFQAWPELAWIAPLPAVMYCAHRGIKEKRLSLIILGALLASLTSASTMYVFGCLLISLGLLLCGLGASRWRDRLFWLHTVLLVAFVALSCAWRIIPLLQNREAQAALSAVEHAERSVGDVVSFVINRENPIVGPVVGDLLGTPADAHIIKKAYLGLLPLALIGIGLMNKNARRKMAPWLGLLSVFLVLSMSETLSINGTVYESVKLPKYYLNQWLPFIFAAFYRPYLFMAGAWLPLAILACHGLMALRERFPRLARPEFILLLIAIAAVEKYDPIAGSPDPSWLESVSDERTAYLDWLAQEEQDPIALVNLPFGFNNSHFYSYAQTLSGFPITEGAISRVPSNALDYARSNLILGAWHGQRPIHCDRSDRDLFLAALAALAADGFSHVVFHRGFHNAPQVADSFAGIQASYSDAFVSVYRLNDLRENCPAELEARHRFAAAYSDALVNSASLQEEPGVLLALPPSLEIAEHFMRYLEQAARPQRAVVVVYSDDQGKVETWSAEAVDLDALNAIWLLQAPLETDAEIAGAAREWLSARFKFCHRVYDGRGSSVDLYLKLDIPCTAVDDNNAVDIRFDGGLRLRFASFELRSTVIRFYLAWRYDSEKPYAFSIQLFSEGGDKVSQYDQVIWPNLLDVHELDRSSIPAGSYLVKLIVYDFETRTSRGGLSGNGQERFERALDLARLAL
ncbi:MAG: hypothetical protein OXG85_05535 [Chloroflexi bacterium]|nr:hypothetical protein [Chloroflexota bacterium]